MTDHENPTEHLIRCGNCQEPHRSVEAIKACHGGATILACGWLVATFRSFGEDEVWPDTVECGAEAILTERGYSCAAGHEHVTMEARHAEGWDYAEDYDEAKALAFAGVEPLTMSGHLVTGPRDFDPPF